MKPTLLPKNEEKQEEVAFEKSKKKRKSREMYSKRMTTTLDFYNNYELDKVKWMHLSCALFVPEIGFIDQTKKSPITGKQDV